MDHIVLQWMLEHQPAMVKGIMTQLEISLIHKSNGLWSFAIISQKRQK
jgi:hypothetical protein